MLWNIIIIVNYVSNAKFGFHSWSKKNLAEIQIRQCESVVNDKFNNTVTLNRGTKIHVILLFSLKKPPTPVTQKTSVVQGYCLHIPNTMSLPNRINIYYNDTRTYFSVKFRNNTGTKGIHVSVY